MPERGRPSTSRARRRASSRQRPCWIRCRQSWRGRMLASLDRSRPTARRLEPAPVSARGSTRMPFIGQLCAQVGGRTNPLKQWTASCVSPTQNGHSVACQARDDWSEGLGIRWKDRDVRDAVSARRGLLDSECRRCLPVARPARAIACLRRLCLSDMRQRRGPAPSG
jgi:hypothetical protein